MRLTRRQLVLGALAGTIAGTVAGPVRAASVTVLEGRAFASGWRAVLPAGADAAAARAAIDRVVADVDRAMSPWRADSEVSAFNRAPTTAWFRPTAGLRSVVGEALELSDRTDCAFDPRVGPLVGRFGFGPIAAPHPNLQGTVLLDGDGMRKEAPGVTLDLCGIAKGHALDLIVAVLDGDGLAGGLVELGGEVRGWGEHPSGRSWQVSVEVPGRDGDAAWCVVAPGPLALATSGHAPNGLAGRASVSHVIDPATGRPARQDLASVSVLAPTAARADALATGMLAVGPEAGPALASRLGVPALFLLPDGEGGLVQRTTSGFADHVVA